MNGVTTLPRASLPPSLAIAVAIELLVDAIYCVAGIHRGERLELSRVVWMGVPSVLIVTMKSRVACTWFVISEFVTAAGLFVFSFVTLGLGWRPIFSPTTLIASIGYCLLAILAKRGRDQLLHGTAPQPSPEHSG